MGTTNRDIYPVTKKNGFLSMVPWKTILLWIGFARCWFTIGQTSKALENMQILVPPFLFNPPILDRIATYVQAGFNHHEFPRYSTAILETNPHSFGPNKRPPVKQHRKPVVSPNKSSINGEFPISILISWRGCRVYHYVFFSEISAKIQWFILMLREVTVV